MIPFWKMMALVAGFILAFFFDALAVTKASRQEIPDLDAMLVVLTVMVVWGALFKWANTQDET